MKKITVLVFLALIFIISILNVFNDNVIFSENENRYLSQFPEISADKILDGNFSEDFESYIQDQMIFRSGFIELKAMFNLNVFSKIQNNSVYVGNNNLVNQFILNDTVIMYNNIDVINKFAYDTDVMLIPTHSAFSENQINSFAYNTNQEELLKNAEEKLTKNYINVYYDLTGNDQNFFSTDHHWNHNGSNTAYQVYCETKNIDEIDYEYLKISENFKGTLYSKSGLFSIDGDDLFTPIQIDDYKLNVVVDDQQYSSVFFKENLKEKDQYTYYLDGNHSYIEITNEDINENSSIVIIKDSYANIFIPLLIPHYKNIYVIDLRYYHSPVSELIEEKKIDEVLIMYNVESFVTDENIRFLR